MNDVIINPMTGRRIKIGGSTHKKLLKTLDTIDDVLNEDSQIDTYKQHGGFGKLLGKLVKKGR
jgi:hypothetical protein